MGQPEARGPTPVGMWDTLHSLEVHGLCGTVPLTSPTGLSSAISSHLEHHHGRSPLNSVYAAVASLVTTLVSCACCNVSQQFLMPSSHIPLGSCTGRGRTAQ